MSYMKTKDYTLSIRIPTETYVALARMAVANHTTASEIARDSLLRSLVPAPEEHVFLSRAQWGKAVKARDEYRCVRCGSERNVAAHHRIPCYQGGENTLSNGETLCDEHHHAAHRTETYVYIPTVWERRQEKYAAYPGIAAEDFWRLHLACYYTQYQRPVHPLVREYAQVFLAEEPIERVKRLLLRVCPHPYDLRNAPSRWNNPNPRKRIEQCPPPEWGLLDR